MSRKAKLITATLVVLLLGGGVATALVLKNQHDTDVAAKRSAARDKMAAAKKRADEADAKKNVADGTLTGPIYSAS